MHYLVKDTIFEKIMEFLGEIKNIHRKNGKKLRMFLEAIYYMARAGCCWRLLPLYYGNWRSVHKRFKKWSMRGIWEKLFEYFQKDPDLEWIMMDSTIVRAHASAAGYGKGTQEKEALGRSRGGFSTKIHILTDALGNPLKFILSPGQRHDITKAPQLIANISNALALADKAYDVDHLIAQLEEQSCKSVIPSRNNRKNPRECDLELYKERNVVERFIGRIKQFRRIFSRYDKAGLSYLSFLHFVGTLEWLK
jgi:transposase